MIKKEYIETFLTVAETKSFSKTAEKIYVTQSAVTQRMDALEKTLGFPLLVRCNKGIQLTGQGEIFLEYAKDSRKKYFQMIERCQAAESRTLRIGCDFEDSTIFFPALIERYLQKYPDVKIEIIGHILTDAFERLLKNEFDICWLPKCGRLREHKEIAYTELIRNLMSCRVSKKHPLAQKSILRIEDLRGYRILLPPQGLTTVSDQMRDYIKAEEPEIDLVEMKNSGYMQGTSTQKNIIQILSSWRRTFVEENCVNIPLEWGDRLGEGLFYQNPASNQVMKFVDIAREAFREGLFEEWVGKQ